MWKNEDQGRSQSILKQQHVWLNRHCFTASWIVMHQNLFVTEMSKQDVNSTLTIMKKKLRKGNVTKVYWFAASTLRKVLFCVCFIDSTTRTSLKALQCATCGCNTCDPHPGFPLERELFLTCVPATGSRCVDDIHRPWHWLPLLCL